MEFQVNVNKEIDGLVFEKETGLFLFQRDGVFYIAGAESQEQAQSSVDTYNPSPIIEPSVEEKLASVGLNVNDLKAALGL